MFFGNVDTSNDDQFLEALSSPSNSASLNGIVPRDLLVSSQPIDDTYEVRRDQVIGSGASSSVVYGIYKPWSTPCAVKIINTRSTPSAAVDVDAEIFALLRASHHPNIITALDVFVPPRGEEQYIVTELCEGGELLQYINDAYRLQEATAKECIRVVLDVLYYLHVSELIAHNDIKPENFIFAEKKLSPGDEIPPVHSLRLIDFGFASSLHHQNYHCGVTVAYAAPERITMSSSFSSSSTTTSPGFEADMWSVGVMLYAMLCGYLPFHGESRQQTVDLIRAGRVVFGQQSEEGDDDEDEEGDWAESSLQVRDFISRLLRVDPRDRMTVQEAKDHDWLRY
eukprot:Nk52_evm1s245 gene=Nk52_evmTU1s245